MSGQRLAGGAQRLAETLEDRVDDVVRVAAGKQPHVQGDAGGRRPERPGSARPDRRRTRRCARRPDRRRRRGRHGPRGRRPRARAPRNTAWSRSRRRGCRRRHPRAPRAARDRARPRRPRRRAGRRPRRRRRDGQVEAGVARGQPEQVVDERVAGGELDASGPSMGRRTLTSPPPSATIVTAALREVVTACPAARRSGRGRAGPLRRRWRRPARRVPPRLVRELDDTDALDEVAHREPLAEARRAAGGQHVVGAGGVVAEGGGGARADEDGAGVAHPRARAPRRRPRAARGARGQRRSRGRAPPPGRGRRRWRSVRWAAPSSAESSATASATRSPSSPPTSSSAAMAPEPCSAWASRSAASQSARPARVGHDQHLARPGEAVDAHLAHDLALGLGDVGVARPDDHVAARHHRRAEGHGGDGLGAADRVQVVDAEQRAGGGDARGDAAARRAAASRPRCARRRRPAAGIAVISTDDG